jgi:hypothetical protein
MFEAGALSKKLDKSNVCPLLFGMEASDIQGPLVQFQAAKFDKLEVKRAVKMMNGLLTESLAIDVLDSVFDMWWPKLEKEVTDILGKQGTAKPSALRSERQLIEEILDLVRASSIKAKSEKGSPSLSLVAVGTLVNKLGDLTEHMKNTGVFGQQRTLLLEIVESLGSALASLNIPDRKGFELLLTVAAENLKGAAAFVEKTEEEPREPEQDDVPF